MNFRAVIRVSVGLLAGAMAVGAQAQTASFYFTLGSDTTGSTPITNANIGGINSTLALSVWVKTTTSFSAFAGESFLAFDTTNETDPFKAPTATTLQNKIGVQGNSTNALTPSNVFGLNNGVYFDLDNSVTPSRFGITYDFGVTNGTPVDTVTPRKLYDIVLYNKGLTANNSFTVSLVNNGATREFENNFIVDDNNSKLSGGSNLAIKAAVPEPATMAVLGIGLIPFLRRRRK